MKIELQLPVGETLDAEGVGALRVVQVRAGSVVLNLWEDREDAVAELCESAA